MVIDVDGKSRLLSVNLGVIILMGRTKSAVGLCLLMVISLFSTVPPTSEESEPALLSELFNGFHAEVSQEVWNQTPWVDIAVPAGFDIVTAMDYSDVGILINNASDTSRAIGWAFVSARNLSSEQIFLIDNPDAPTGETINRNQFNTYFADPFRAMLSDQNHSSNLNYIVTTDGVPLRINGGNDKASFDQELAMIGGTYNSSIGNNYWVNHDYGPLAGKKIERFTREEYGFFLVTRLTGYDVETAIGLIEKANNSIGSRGNFVLDKASNRDGSGYKFWNDDLGIANTTLNSTLGLPTFYDQSSTFVTNVSDVIGYASWGSNDGDWNRNFLQNGGFDTLDNTWSSGSKYWNSSVAQVTGGDIFNWTYQTEIKQGGNGAIGAQISTTCTQETAYLHSGIYAEYFDNEGISFNTASMPTLIDRTPDHIRVENRLAYSSSSNPYSGLDNRFKHNWGARFSGLINVPENGNWTFYLNSDDGSELWINGASAIQNYGSHGMREYSTSMVLESGYHDFRIEFFQGGGPHGLILSWEGPNVSKTSIPSSAFFVASDLVPEPNNLIHSWGFEEGSGTQTNDSIGEDNFTLHGMDSGNWRNCVSGGCLWFDGIDDYAEVDVENWTGNFTISQWVWANVSNQSTYASTFAIDDNAGSHLSFQHMISNGKWQFHNNQSKAFGDVESQRWTNLVSVYESGELRQYMDGVLVNSNSFPLGYINNFDLYRLGVNRAGTSFFQGMIDGVKIWNTSLSNGSITSLSRDIITNCSAYSGSGQSVAFLETMHNIPVNFTDHAWNVYVQGRRSGDAYGEFNVEISSIDSNGNELYTNSSQNQVFTSNSWSSSSLRFRPHQDAKELRIRIAIDIVPTSTDGSLIIDSAVLRVIRPHLGWINGSIAETAVSTGGRSFEWGTTYGQSLVADLLEDGVSGVKGYVYEPYLTAVSYPSVLLPTYAQGYTMAESYYAANRMLGWMGVVVGDPKMAAYADKIHDVNIIDARVVDNLSTSINGTIQIALENVGLGEADGWLTVRHRVGGEILINNSLTLPAGDKQGSRIIIELDILSHESGWNDFLIRYDANTSSSQEWNLVNNLVTIPVYVNEHPEIIEISCDSDQYVRGYSILCSVSAEDDSNISKLDLAWRVSSENESTEWIWLNTGSSNGFEWWTSIQLPYDTILGNLDLKAIAIDDNNVSSEEHLQLAVAEILDAQGQWFGPHIEGADPEDWNGVSNLPSRTAGSAPRGQSLVIKACVMDPDHVRNEEKPLIEVAGVQLIEYSILQSSDEQLVCYGMNWTHPIGSSIEDVPIELWDHKGKLTSTRAIRIEDEPGKITVELISGDRLKSDGKDELRITWLDSDDPETGAIGDIIISWPGNEPNIIPVELNFGENVVQIPAGMSAIESGEAKFEFILQGKHGTTSTNVSYWHVQLTPPEIIGLNLCMGEKSLDELYFGKVAIAVVQVESNRFIESISVSMKQSGWSVEAPSIEEEEAALCWDDKSGFVKFFRVRLDSSFIKGDGSMVVSVSDRDGLIDSSYLPLVFKNQGPSVEINPPLNATASSMLSLELNVSDPDGLIGAYCLTKILMPNDSLITEIRTDLEGIGIQVVNWPIPSDMNGSVSVETSCWDSTEERADSLRKVVIILPSNESEIDTIPKPKSDDGTASNTPMIIGASSAGILFIILMTIISIRRKGKEEGEQSAFGSGELTDDSLYEAAWPPQ